MKATIPSSFRRSEAQRKKTGIHVIGFGLLRRGLLNVGRLDTFIDARIGSVLVVVVFVLLISVVGRVADYDADLTLVLPFDARDVLVAD